ncbi:MAG: hypothetical protein WCJ35_23440 [Planctomycetota bacterium]
MSEQFDPYHKWLGIRPEEQPANHYRLLGITLFEDDLDTITHAADQRMAHVKSFQTGQHSTLSQKLLNEIAASRICLLNPEKKANYDESLRQLIDSPDIPLETTPSVSSPETAYVDFAGFQSTHRPSARRRKQQSWQVPALAILAGMILLLLIAAVVAFSGKKESAISKAEEQVAPFSKPEQQPIRPPKKTEPIIQPKPKEARPSAEGENLAVVPPQLPVPPPVVKEEPPAETVKEMQRRLTTALADAKGPAEFKAVAEHALELVDRAIVDSKQDVVKSVANLALSAARRSDDTALAKQATLRVIEADSPPSDAMKEKARNRLNGLVKDNGLYQSGPVTQMLVKAEIDNHNWKVLIRSSNPKIWNTDVNDPKGGFAISISKVPDNIKYLRIQTDNKPPVIIPITKDRLLIQSADGRSGWQGANFFNWQANHLGVYDMNMNSMRRGAISLVCFGNMDDRSGWGFGHRAGVDDHQAYVWAGDEIPETVFKISVTSSDLTKVEEQYLLK